MRQPWGARDCADALAARQFGSEEIEDEADAGHMAIVEMCGAAPDFDLAGKNDVRQCRRNTRRVASAQADVVVANAAQGRPIQVSSIRN